MARKPKRRIYPDRLSCQQALRAATPTLAEDVRQGRVDHFPPRYSYMVGCSRRDCRELLYPAHYIATYVDRDRHQHAGICEDCRNNLRLEDAQAWQRYERERRDGTLEPVERDEDDRRDDDAVEAQLDPHREIWRWRYLAVTSRRLVCRFGSRRICVSKGADDRADLEFRTAVVYADGTSAQLTDPDPTPAGTRGTAKARAAA